MLLSLREKIEAHDLPHYNSGHTESQAIIQPGMTMSKIEKEALRRTLQHTNGHRSQTDEILDISVRTLQRKIKEFGLDSDV